MTIIKTSNKSLRKTKICHEFTHDRKCQYDDCNFAHSIKEFNPLKCKFDNNCHNNYCQCAHTKTGSNELETNYDIVNRLELKKMLPIDSNSNVFKSQLKQMAKKTLFQLLKQL